MRERSRDDAWVYNELRHEIENLILKPGEELDVNELTERYGVSRSPVRDALLRLKRDSLVDIFPQRGTRVSKIDLHQVAEERFMRKSLELGAISEMMKKLDGDKRTILITLLRSILLKQHAALLSNDLTEFLKADDEMHYLFFSTADLVGVWAVLRAHSGNDYRVRMLSFETAGIAKEVEEQHKALIDAIESGDKAKVLELDRAHLSKIDDEYKTLIESFPDYFLEAKK